MNLDLTKKPCDFAPRQANQIRQNNKMEENRRLC